MPGDSGNSCPTTTAASIAPDRMSDAATYTACAPDEHALPTMKQGPSSPCSVAISPSAPCGCWLGGGDEGVRALCGRESGPDPPTPGAHAAGSPNDAAPIIAIRSGSCRGPLIDSRRSARATTSRAAWYPGSADRASRTGDPASSSTAIGISAAHAGNGAPPDTAPSVLYRANARTPERPADRALHVSSALRPAGVTHSNADTTTASPTSHLQAPPSHIRATANPEVSRPRPPPRKPRFG
ncbi:MAG: hypothetical protein R3F14_16220 [Polyangiaceae bacterium]